MKPLRLTVLLLAAAMGQSIRLPRADWRPAALAGLFNITGWFYFTAVGLTLLPAGTLGPIFGRYRWAQNAWLNQQRDLRFGSTEVTIRS